MFSVCRAPRQALCQGSLTVTPFATPPLPDEEADTLKSSMCIRKESTTVVQNLHISSDVFINEAFTEI